MMAGQPEGLALRDAWFGWIDQSLPVLESEGWLVELIGADNFNLSQSDGIDGEVETEGNDWFSLRFDLKFDGWVMPLVPLVSQLIDRYQPGELPDKLYLDTGEGHYVAVPAEQIEPVLKTILDLFDRIRDDRLELGRADAGVLLDLAGIPVQGGTSLHKLARQLRNFSGLKPVKLPTTFKGQLRDYQQHGVDWLQFLREQALGGILADDMGLGKNHSDSCPPGRREAGRTLEGSGADRRSNQLDEQLATRSRALHTRLERSGAARTRPC